MTTTLYILTPFEENFAGKYNTADTLPTRMAELAAEIAHFVGSQNFAMPTIGFERPYYALTFDDLDAAFAVRMRFNTLTQEQFEQESERKRKEDLERRNNLFGVMASLNVRQAAGQWLEDTLLPSSVTSQVPVAVDPTYRAGGSR